MNRRTASAKVRNAVMNHFASYEVFKENRKKSEEARSSENRPHEILYFHKVDDPYSHLTIQFIDRFRSSYNIQFKPILVGEENPETVHEPSLYNIYCLEDVRRIAPYYDVSFSAHSYPSKDLTTKANRILSAVQEANFGEVGKEVSTALWSADEACLDELLKEYSVSEKDAQQKIRDGNSIRDEKDYYFGSAFYYENELYWGVDRLHYLERRLSELNLGRANEFTPTCKPRLVAPSTLSSSKQFNLTYYPSLNSPYTFVSTKRIRQLQENYPINLITKPVLPMLMRMMTIPTFKAKYIISDAAREGRTHKHEIKKIYSPIGKPARKAYALFPIIDEMGKGFEYIEALLIASFQDEINIGNDAYLEDLVSSLRLDWSEVKKHLNNKQWKKDLNHNLQEMYAGNCWGVPSFKLTDDDGENPFYVWGQDRMWLIQEEIAKRSS
jgi:2-hydroxychromene-2-carboxylate isomerase